MSVLNKISRGVNRLLHAPRPGLSPQATLRLGTSYGGWEFLDRPDLVGSTIISCGLGEDGSFDVAFAARYGAKVIIVDPTPLAVAHFAAITARLGKSPEVPFSNTGKQPPEAYNLSSIRDGQLILLPKAVWTEETTLPFFAPAEAGHVSYSLTNFQNNYSRSGDHILVPTVTLPQILADHGLDRLPLLKMDIEGAEGPVLEAMLASGLLPGQILVEYDELTIPSATARRKFDKTDTAIRSAGYEAISWDGRSNFLYALP